MAKVEMEMPEAPEGWAYTGEFRPATLGDDYATFGRYDPYVTHAKTKKVHCDPKPILRKLEPTPEVCSWREIGGAGSNFECGCDEDNPHSVRPLVAERMTYCPYCSLPISLVEEEPEAETFVMWMCNEGCKSGRVCIDTTRKHGYPAACALKATDHEGWTRKETK